MRQPRRIEAAERAVGRRQQPAAVVQADADIAGAARGQPALEDRAADLADLLAQPALLARHRPAPGIVARACAKKSGPPKLPDLSAMASGSPPIDTQAG